MGTSKGGGCRLPEDVVVEILSWLPVKALFRFKCVRKSWSTLVPSSDFVSRHLDNYYNKSCDGCLLAHISRTDNQPDFFELFPDETLEDLSRQPFHLPFPTTALCGPCNGIYYLATGLIADGALWNPATKELRLLPAKLNEPNLPPSTDAPYWEPEEWLMEKSIEMGLPPYLVRFIDAYGFGLDEMTKDYKVVVVRHLWDESRRTQYYPSSAIVYSLRTNCWRYWGELAHDCWLSQDTSYTYVNGVFYWLGDRYCRSELPRKLILSFDFSKDSFEEIPVPADYPDSDYYWTLSLYHDSIALFLMHIVDKFVDILVTADEGNWTKRFTIAPLLEIQRPIGGAYWKNGKIVLQYRNSSGTTLLFLCDPSTQQVRNLGLEAPSYISGLLVHKESLVPVKDI